MRVGVIFCPRKHGSRGPRVHKRLLITCDQCSRVFRAPYGRAKRPLHFCSRDCVTIARKSGGLVAEKQRRTSLKRYGTEFPHQSVTVRATLSASLRASSVFAASQQRIVNDRVMKYGTAGIMATVEMREKARQTSLKNWGVENPLQHPDVKARKVAKQKLTNYASGRWIAPAKLTEFERYSREIHELTKQQPLWSLDGYKRPLRANDLSIDHIYSIAAGFRDGIEAHIIAHITNLRVVSRSENARKHVKCDKTIQQLYSDIVAYDRKWKLK